jgi:predicted Fe-Mo cluster-binding NifX family protein
MREAYPCDNDKRLDSIISFDPLRCKFLAIIIKNDEDLIDSVEMIPYKGGYDEFFESDDLLKALKDNSIEALIVRNADEEDMKPLTKNGIRVFLVKAETISGALLKLFEKDFEEKLYFKLPYRKFI